MIFTRRQKKHARSKATQAINKGIIVRPKSCEKCNRYIPLHAHHDDYSKPLDVRFLCSRCHWNWHKKNGYAPVRKEKGEKARSAFTMTIDSKVMNKLKRHAKEKEISVAELIRRIMEAYVENRLEIK